MHLLRKVVFTLLPLALITNHQALGQNCVDKDEPFMAVKPGADGWSKMKTCDGWVSRKSTAWRCFNVAGVTENCPLTCANCCEDTSGAFTLLGNGKAKDCAWAEVNPGTRCRKPPTRQLCSVTCGICAATPAPTPAPTVGSTPAPTADPCTDLNASCESWASVGECDNNPNYMLVNCRRSCNVCTRSRAQPGATCTQNSECESDFCDPTTKVCYASDKCVALTHSPGETFEKGTKVVLVIVGSDFTDLTTWQNQVAVTYSDFGRFPFFGDDSDYVAFYVNKVQDSFCELGCNNIDRLLCCSTSTAISVAASCFGNVASLQVLSIHNDSTYGGAGGEIATVTTHHLSSLVGVHEIGHSLFNLQDEYDWDYSAFDVGPNCDSTPGCPRWSDLLTTYPNLCTYKGCGGGNYYISEENSFMLSANDKVGPVLRRFTCCTFYALTSSAPDYCNEFLNAGDGLINFCTNNGYTPAGFISAERQVDRATITTPSGTFVFVDRPIAFFVEISSLNSSGKSGSSVTVNAADIQGGTSSESGFYASTKFYGDFSNAKDAAVSGSSDGYYIQADIIFDSGDVETRFYASFTTLFGPPEEVSSGDTNVLKEEAPVRMVKVPKSSIEIVVETNVLDPISQVTVKRVGI